MRLPLVFVQYVFLSHLSWLFYDEKRGIENYHFTKVDQAHLKIKEIVFSLEDESLKSDHDRS